MTQQMGGYPPPETYSTDVETSTSTSSDASTTEVAREEARGVGESVKEAGTHVAQTATDQVRDVAAETKQQARNLMQEGRQQVRQQARTSQYRAAEGLTSISHELRQMADNGGQEGLAAEMARQAADQVQNVAGWLQNREPGELYEEARDWARNHPGMFLIGAALAGLVAGRLTRGVMVAQKDEQEWSGPVDEFNVPRMRQGYQSADPALQQDAGYAGQQQYGQQHAGQQYPDQPYSGQQYSGQQYAGQQNPGQYQQSYPSQYTGQQPEQQQPQYTGPYQGYQNGGGQYENQPEGRTWPETGGR